MDYFGGLHFCCICRVRSHVSVICKCCIMKNRSSTKFRSFKLQNTFVLAVYSCWRPYNPNKQINLKKCTFLKQSFSIIHTIIKTANRFPVDLRFEFAATLLEFCVVISVWLLYGCQGVYGWLFNGPSQNRRHPDHCDLLLSRYDQGLSFNVELCFFCFSPVLSSSR